MAAPVWSRQIGSPGKIVMKSQNSRFDRTLTYTFAAILMLQVGFMLIGFASTPLYYQRVSTQTVEPVSIAGEVILSNAIVERMAAIRGLSLGQYAIYRIIVTSLAALIPLVVAFLIIWRTRRQWFAWFTACIIVFLGVSSLSDQINIARFIPEKAFGANAIFWFLVLLYIFLFPNGKAVPRRAGWLVIALVAYHSLIQAGTVISYFAPDLAARFNLPSWGNSDYIWPVVLNFPIILACQIYRYRRISTLTERQQTKWFLFGFGLIIALIPVSILVDSTQRDGFLNDFTDLALWLPLYLSLAVAILRYRLFDIDILIRRTLQYGIITALLALVYFGIVTVLQSVFTALGGAQSPVITVISTLAIAALFNPLRRRVQDFIDRRFYRRKYDAQKTLEEFAAIARSEVEMEPLTQHLLAVVENTMQSQGVSLWLRPSGRGKLGLLEKGS